MFCSVFGILVRPLCQQLETLPTLKLSALDSRFKGSLHTCLLPVALTPKWAAFILRLCINHLSYAAMPNHTLA